MEKHPKLAEKLQLLYLLQLNPQIRTHADLSRELGISKQAVTKWCRGGQTSRGNAIPKDQVTPVSVLFEIDPIWFSLPYTSFEKKLRRFAQQSLIANKTRQVRISTGTLPNTDLNIYGRESELQLLDELWDAAKVNVVEILAFGGSGKSALINKWLSELSKSGYRGAKNVYAWSFYWQSESVDVHSAGDYFVEHALEWFGDPEPGSGSHWSKAARLAALVRSSKTLLLLDGLETLQHAGADKFGMIDNPAVSLLIKELASDNHGLCVITSRLHVTDLESFLDGRVLSYEIPALDKQSSRRLLKHLGVVGASGELDKLASSYAGHPLSLVLLAGYLTTAHKGELSQFSTIKTSFADKHRLGYLKKLMHDYLHWLSEQPGIQVLRLLSLVGRSISISDLIALGREKAIVGLTDKLQTLSEVEWNFVIKDLKETRLVSLDSIEGDRLLDCHPLIRDYVDERLCLEMADVWIQGHAIIFNFLLQKLSYSPNNMMDLDPFFRTVIHGVRAGKIEEAFNFYYVKIKNRQFSMLTEGSHYADQACIRAFFDREWDKPVAQLSEDAQHYLSMSAATNLIYLGKIEQAIGPSIKSIEWFRQRGEHMHAALATGPLISMYIATGNLAAASALLDDVEQDVEGAQDPVLEAMLKNFRAYILFLEGDNEQAKALFEMAERELLKLIPESDVHYPTISSYYCRFLLETGELTMALERSLKTMAWRRSGSWQVAFDTTSLLASDVLVLGLVFLALGDKVNAKLQLDRQVEMFKTGCEWLYLPSGLNSRARFHAATANLEAALRDLQESLEISQRTGARFGEWEAHLDMAQLYACCDRHEDARTSLRNAANLQGMNRYKFRDKEILELSERLAIH